jgi:hypothetical protein
MKLIGIMSLASDQQKVREVFERHDVEIYSEVDIKGHTKETLRQYGWWPSTKDAPAYSVLYFAILAEPRADEIMTEMEALAHPGDSVHAIRAFQVDVEKMV